MKLTPFQWFDIITGKTKYKSQLHKQNSLVAYGFKVFRWSLEGMKTTDNFYDEVKKYIGNLEDLQDLQKLSVSREITLLNHQIDSLKELEQRRNGGEKNFLVVLPTGTGKTDKTGMRVEFSAETAATISRPACCSPATQRPLPYSRPPPSRPNPRQFALASPGVTERGTVADLAHLSLKKNVLDEYRNR